ncbi:MAG: TLC domain-containing protein [Sulfobacillus sp.]
MDLAAWLFMWGVFHVLFARAGVPKFMLTRCASTLHAIVAFTVAVHYLLVPDLRLVSFVRPMTLSYCIYDVAVNVFAGTASFWEVIFHHSVFGYIVVQVLPLLPGPVMRGYLCEVTNPFLNYGYYCIKAKKTRGVAFCLCALAVFSTFLVFRVLNFTAILWEHRKSSESLGFVLGAAVTLLNYYWFARICVKTLEVVKGACRDLCSAGGGVN